MFTKEFIEGLPDNPGEAGKLLCNSFMSEVDGIDLEQARDMYSDLVAAYETIKVLIEVSNYQIDVPDLGSDLDENISTIFTTLRDASTKFSNVAATEIASSFRNMLLAKYGSGFVYEFTEGDVSRIQQLINELRERIQDNENLEDEHRARLLRRLERLQSELHKKVSDLDRYWGLIGDAGVVLGKLGESAKPIVDRVKEISEIIWRTQARAEELPSGVKPALLASDDASESEP